jgi:hypothetical protein
LEFLGLGLESTVLIGIFSNNSLEFVQLNRRVYRFNGRDPIFLVVTSQLLIEEDVIADDCILLFGSVTQ